MEKEPTLGAAHLNPEWNADRPQHTGVTTLFDAVEGIRFPIGKEALIQVKGDEIVDLTGHRPEKLRVILLRTEADEFFSVTDLVEKLEHAL